MNDTNSFDKHRQSSQPYLPAQGQASFPASQNGRVSPQAAQGQYQRPSSQFQSPPPPTQQRRGTAAARMPKAQALELARKVKRGILIASFLCFGTFSALALGHTMGATAQQASTDATKTTTTTPAATTTQGAATATPVPTTTTQNGGGYGFGSNNPTNGPVSGSHTS